MFVGVGEGFVLRWWVGWAFRRVGVWWEFIEDAAVAERMGFLGGMEVGEDRWSCLSGIHPVVTRYLIFAAHVMETKPRQKSLNV